VTVDHHLLIDHVDGVRRLRTAPTNGSVVNPRCEKCSRELLS